MQLTKHKFIFMRIFIDNIYYQISFDLLQIYHHMYSENQDEIVIEISCKICEVQYSKQQDSRPMMICFSQHLICLGCLKKLPKDQCPYCKQKIQKKLAKTFRLFDEVKKMFTNRQKLKEAKIIRQDYLQLLRQIDKCDGYLSNSNKTVKMGFLFQHLKQQYEIAVEYFKNKKIEEAVQLLKKEIENNTQYNLFVGLGAKVEQIGFYQSNINFWFEKYYHSKSNMPMFYDLLALCFLVQVNFERQKSWYESLINLYPNNIPLIFGLATLYFNKWLQSKEDLYIKFKYIKEAKQLYTKVIKINNQCNISYEMLAFIALKEGKISQARKLCLQSYKIQPENYYCKYIYAIVHEPGRQEWAISELQSLMAQNQTYSIIYMETAMIYVSINMCKQSLPHLQQCLIYNPTWRIPKLYLACLKNQFGQVQKAIQILKEISNQETLKTTMLQINISSTEEEKKILILSALMDISKSEPPHHKRNAFFIQLCKKNNKYQWAIVLMIQTYFNSKNYQICEQIADLYLRLNNFDDAQHWYKEYIKNDPKCHKVLMKLAKIYEGKDQCQKSEKLFHRCLQISNNYQHVLNQIIGISSNKQFWESKKQNMKNNLSKVPIKPQNKENSNMSNML